MQRQIQGFVAGVLDRESLLVADQFQAPCTGLNSSAGCSPLPKTTRNRPTSRNSTVAFRVSTANCTFSAATPLVKVSSETVIMRAHLQSRAASIDTSHSRFSTEANCAAIPAPAGNIKTAMCIRHPETFEYSRQSRSTAFFCLILIPQLRDPTADPSG